LICPESHSVAIKSSESPSGRKIFLHKIRSKRCGHDQQNSDGPLKRAGIRGLRLKPAIIIGYQIDYVKHYYMLFTESKISKGAISRLE